MLADVCVRVCMLVVYLIPLPSFSLSQMSSHAVR